MGSKERPSVISDHATPGVTSTDYVGPHQTRGVYMINRNYFYTLFVRWCATGIWIELVGLEQFFITLQGKVRIVISFLHTYVDYLFSIHENHDEVSSLC